MRILYVAMKYDYGKQDQGYSFEHYAFYHSLLHMGHDILYFDFMTLMQNHGRDGMNRRLLEVAKSESPDLMFTVLFKDELDPLMVRELTENTGITTLNWFCDDHWRFETYSRYWAPCFKWVVTTAASAMPKYASLGCHHVIKSQWACNDFLYRKMDLPLKYDAAFVGQPHGNRRQVIQALRRAGVKVHVWGTGWESGRLTQEEMIRVFNETRINLNLSNASPSPPPPAPSPGSRARAWLSRSLDSIPLGSRVKAMRKALFPGRRASAPAPAAEMVQTLGPQPTDQIKARNFEIPGCGGFLLTGKAENLEEYYEIGKEVVCFGDVDELVEQVRYYLNHEQERAAIAEAGYQRTLRDHTYRRRFSDIFQQLELTEQHMPAHAGQTVEVR